LQIGVPRDPGLTVREIQRFVKVRLFVMHTRSKKRRSPGNQGFESPRLQVSYSVSYADEIFRIINIVITCPPVPPMSSPVLRAILRPQPKPVSKQPHQSRETPISESRGGQPFTYDLFDALRPSEFERRGSWLAKSSEPPNCCWASGITPQFRRDSIRRDPSTASSRTALPDCGGCCVP
jgi:hypothetical protein